MKEVDLGVVSSDPAYTSIFEALDNVETKMNFMRMLGYEPKYDDKGNLIAWEEVKEPTYKDILVSTLSLISSKKTMSIASIDDVEPLSEVEVETKVELILELADLLTPPDVDTLPYLPAMEWAKLEMKKGLTLADKGMVVRALMGVPIMPEQEAVPAIPKPEEKRGLFAKLLGGK